MVAVKVQKGFCLAKNMTLRDYFAAAALQGICSTLNVAGEVKYTLIAEDAYKIADAMIAERSEA